MKVVVLQSNYIPWKGYYELLNDADVFCFYDEVQYTKNDWRNRNKLYGTNGLFWLTIPVSADAVKLKISEVKLDSTEWQSKHFKTIGQTYKKAPFFEQVFPLLEDFYLKNQWSYLSEANQYFIRQIATYMGIQTKIVNSKDYELTTGRVERLLHLLKQLGCTTYISGPSAKDYLGSYEEDFQKNGMQIIYKQYGNYNPYKQNGNHFENFVSVIDTLSFAGKADLKNYAFSNLSVDMV